MPKPNGPKLRKPAPPGSREIRKLPVALSLIEARARRARAAGKPPLPKPKLGSK